MNDKKETSREFIFVDPKNDVAFRKIFGDENKKEILISFLNNILDFAGSDKEIMDIAIQNPYQVPKLKDLKETILEWSKEELEAYDARGICIQDERGRIEYALEEGIKIGEEKGKEEGIKIGEEKGKEEGIKIGEEKGKEQKAIETAKKMLEKGFDLETIVEITGLEPSGIDRL